MLTRPLYGYDLILNCRVRAGTGIETSGSGGYFGYSGATILGELAAIPLLTKIRKLFQMFISFIKLLAFIRSSVFVYFYKISKLLKIKALK